MTAFRRLFSSSPRIIAAGLIVFVSACHRQRPAARPAPVPTPPPPAAITTAPALIRAMHDRYEAHWYQTFTFTQKTTVALPSGHDLVQTWYEAGELPGHLRIDTDLGSKGGVLYARDSIYSFAGGRLVRADTGVNDLLVLGFDLYTQPVSRSESILRHLGFDLNMFHEGTWNGRQVYVVGAERGDTNTKQFWIEKDHLLFVRLLEHTRQGHSDVRFENYVPTNGGWMAEQVAQYIDGKRRLLEQYSDVQTNVALPAGLFDPKLWSRTSWLRQ